MKSAPLDHPNIPLLVTSRRRRIRTTTTDSSMTITGRTRSTLVSPSTRAKEGRGTRMVWMGMRTPDRGNRESDHERVQPLDLIWMTWTTKTPLSLQLPRNYLTPAQPLPPEVVEVVPHLAVVHPHEEPLVTRPHHPPYITPVKPDHGEPTRMPGRPLGPRGRKTLPTRILPF